MVTHRLELDELERALRSVLLKPSAPKAVGAP
jgi:hypothetical protein